MSIDLSNFDFSRFVPDSKESVKGEWYVKKFAEHQIVDSDDKLAIIEFLSKAKLLPIPINDIYLVSPDLFVHCMITVQPMKSPISSMYKVRFQKFQKRDHDGN